MTPIVSCLIPSKSRSKQCERVMQTIRGTTTAGNVEIILRLDDDDTLSHYADATKMADHVIVGKCGAGYSQHGKFYNDCAEAARAPWVAMFNDDTEVRGGGWDEMLKSLPLTGVMAQPEFHQLNASLYDHDAMAPVPIVPNGCWKQYGQPEIGTPTDRWLYDLLMTNGWTTHFLPGITIYHDRHK